MAKGSMKEKHMGGKESMGHKGMGKKSGGFGAHLGKMGKGSAGIEGPGKK